MGEYGGVELKTDYGYLIDQREDIYIFANKSARIHAGHGIDIELTPSIVNKIVEQVKRIEGRQGEREGN